MRQYDPNGQPSNLPCHQYQRQVTQTLVNQFDANQIASWQHPVLNLACKEDPAFLGRDFNAINMDQQDFDPQEGMSLYDLPNFECGSALDIQRPDGVFGIVVIGELLEHCPYDAAQTVLSEASRVVMDNGYIILTFPLDPRKPEQQHAKEHLVTWDGGITSWHQSVWDDESFAGLIASVGLKEMPSFRSTLQYGFCNGTGCALVKDRGETLPSDEVTDAAG